MVLQERIVMKTAGHRESFLLKPNFSWIQQPTCGTLQKGDWHRLDQEKLRGGIEPKKPADP
jgi:hypothetical protein